MLNGLKKINTMETNDQLFFNDVIDGLTRSQKQLPPKYFYDKQGSEYFDRICGLEEYYPYRTELALLRTVANDMRELLVEKQAIVEFGAGSLQKIKPLLDEVETITSYMPVDISGEHLQASCEDLQRTCPDLMVKPVVADFTQHIALNHNPDEQKLGFFPGSTIGNFTPDEARTFLCNARDSLGRDGRLLIGVDTKKSPQVLHKAYNDSRGITARFNMNILERINRELKANFVTARFEHYAFYNAAKGCIEMHLVCTEKHTTKIDGIAIDFAAGESIHTENSYKYTPDEFAVLARDAGWQIERRWMAGDDLFSIYLLN